MKKSILSTIKKMLGIEEAYDHFDSDIIVHINSAFMTLTQLGVGPEEGFYILDKEAEWTEFLNRSSKMFHLVKSYVYLKVKVVFDPPTSSYVLNGMNTHIQELEWRLTVLAEEEGSREVPLGAIDYNTLINLPSLNGTTLKGNVELDDIGAATEEYVDEQIEESIGVIEDGYY